MFPQMMLARLTDVSGRVLLVRRSDSLLWTLPGGVARAPVSSRSEFLSSCCRRQIGVTPDFVGPMTHLDFSGQSVAVGVDEIGTERVRACGRVIECRWFQSDALPVDVAPLARLAVVILDPVAAENSPSVVSSVLATTACG